MKEMVKVLGDPRQPLTGHVDSLFVTDCKVHTELKYADHLREIEAAVLPPEVRLIRLDIASVGP
jgi:hypothetical protein